MPQSEGFHTLKAIGEKGSSDLVAHAAAPLDELLHRSTKDLDPYLGGFAEHWYWAQAFLMSRGVHGPNSRHDAALHVALNMVGMQGVTDIPGPPAAPPEEEVVKVELVMVYQEQVQMEQQILVTERQTMVELILIQVVRAL